MSNELDPPDLPREITTSLGEHDILLSFNNDDTAEMFSDWWYTVGQNMFAKYLRNAKRDR